MKKFFQQKIIQKEADFFYFLDNCNDFSEEDCLIVRKKVQNTDIKKIIHVFFVLLIWSGFAAFIDAALFSSSVIASVMSRSFEFFYFLLFFVANILLKIWYIGHQLSFLHWHEKIVASLPYFGGGYLLVHALKKETLLRKSLWKFLKQK